MTENHSTKTTNEVIRLKNSNASIFVKYTVERLKLQRVINTLVLLPFCGGIILIFKYILRYKIQDIKIIRKQFKEIIKNNNPIIICSNHLTFIDSCLIIWALASIFWYQFHFKFFSWNLPAGDFFGKKKRYRLIALLCKCIFIHRDASPNHHNEILDICKKILKKGEVVTIFPEGKRSRTGYFDPNQLTYGVGKIIQNVPNCRVLCVYIRGDKQETFSNYPVKNSTFYMKMNVITPTTELFGKEGCSEIVNQIAQTIKKQEEEYFSSHNSGVIKRNEIYRTQEQNTSHN
ncbi:lysophospholipid acyltransferase family protein [Fluviispira multicolorata]|uniref:Phospholipid/glycerol acyltransferase domain-containing protein n=1 Tax=Fluviispira multicolorata TaxID=2654512 RepID=A0A833JBV0_9BACT|nr:lysophospholipid acyltransferase family protein [Fluviispira multicolorata]KAB8029086.1 hypothetical protein GCL57_11135 [Fluviispira multicolorata]